MRRRRQQKLEGKLQQFRSKDGGPDTGGTLKIYGESLCRDVPYKTLLLSVRDTAQQVVREMLTKYGLDRETDPHSYCLLQVRIYAIFKFNNKTSEMKAGMSAMYPDYGFSCHCLRNLKYPHKFLLILDLQLSAVRPLELDHGVALIFKSRAD